MRWQKRLSHKYHSQLFNVEGCLMPIYPQRLHLVRALEGRPDDIYVASFTKAGTTWTQEMVFMIATGMDYNASDKSTIQTRFPYLDMGVHPMAMNNCSLKMLAAMPHNQPRFIKAHLPYHLLPYCVSRLQNKVVYVMRNPSDVIVSCFHFYERIIKTYTGSFHDFFADFINDRLPYCPYLDHVLGYWHRRQDPNICVVSYEEMHKDFRGVVRRVAAFLERPMTEAMISALVEHCSFKSMKSNPSVNYETEPVMDLTEVPFMRKGIVGDWKNHFTPGMQAAVIKWVTSRLRGSGLNFIFSLDPSPSRHSITKHHSSNNNGKVVQRDNNKCNVVQLPSSTGNNTQKVNCENNETADSDVSTSTGNGNIRHPSLSNYSVVKRVDNKVPSSRKQNVNTTTDTDTNKVVDQQDYNHYSDHRVRSSHNRQSPQNALDVGHHGGYRSGGGGMSSRWQHGVNGGEYYDYGCYYGDVRGVDYKDNIRPPITERLRIQDKRRLSLPSQDNTPGDRQTRVVYDGNYQYEMDDDLHQRTATTAVTPVSNCNSTATASTPTQADTPSTDGYCYKGVHHDSSTSCSIMQQTSSDSSSASTTPHHAANDDRRQQVTNKQSSHDGYYSGSERGQYVHRTGDANYGTYNNYYGLQHRASTNMEPRLGSGYVSKYNHENQFYQQIPFLANDDYWRYDYRRYGYIPDEQGKFIMPLKYSGGTATEAFAGYSHMRYPEQCNFVNNTTRTNHVNAAAQYDSYTPVTRHPPCPPPPTAMPSSTAVPQRRVPQQPPTAQQLYSGYYSGYYPATAMTTAGAMTYRSANRQNFRSGSNLYFHPPAPPPRQMCSSNNNYDYHAPTEYHCNSAVTMGAPYNYAPAYWHYNPPAPAQRRSLFVNEIVRRQSIAAAAAGTHDRRYTTNHDTGDQPPSARRLPVEPRPHPPVHVSRRW